MASIHKEVRKGKTYWRLQFYDKDNQRRSVRLGRVNKKAAEAIRAKVEHLVAASVAGTPLDNETSNWLVGIGADLADKLAKVGLCERRQSTFLASFLDDYITSRTDVRPSTLGNFRALRRSLVGFFGADRSLRSVEPADADAWRKNLVDNGMAEATISKLVKRARQVFKVAVRQRLVDENVFADVPTGSERNEKRMCFVDQATIAAVIDACPDVEWRTIVALARYGGLRTPSEIVQLKWADINWEKKRFVVTSPKTEKQNKPYRTVPLFPELRPFLEEAFDNAPEGSVYVITRYRRASDNLRTQLLRIIRRAGVQPWPKPFQNLRASRETELANEFPLHVVTDWLGNTPRVADRHYLQTIEEHFELAAGKGGATVGAVVAQQSAPQPAARSRDQPQEKQQTPALTGVVRDGATQCGTMRIVEAPRKQPSS